MSAPRRQHYVPRFYLRGFFDPLEEAKNQNILWLYERDRFPTRKSAKDVGYALHLYDVGSESLAPADAKSPGYFEKQLHVFEDLAVPILRKLGAGDLGITKEQRSEFAGFMALSMCRTPLFMQTIDQVAVNYQMASLQYWYDNPETLEKLMAGIEDDSKGEVTVESMRTFIGMLLESKRRPEQRDRAWTIKLVLESMINYMDVFAAMRWRILAPPPGQLFITCDNPVLFIDPEFKAAQPRKAVTWSRACALMFPLSRSFLLRGAFEDGLDETGEATPAEWLRFTRTTVARALREVYAPVRDDALRRLVDEIHSSRPPLVQDVPPEFFYQYFAPPE